MVALYLHLPFCLRKCRYCAFNSRAAPPELISAYLESLRAELEDFAGTRPGPLGTIYLGGGTPTILTGAQLGELLNTLFGCFSILPGAEVTVEANPGTVDREKARLLRSLGVNRVSLGIQSLRDDLLKRLGRVHTAREALEALDLLREAGFANLGADLIYALPGQTRTVWEEDLRRLLDVGPEHLSLYALTVEPGTPFHRARRRGTLRLPGEDQEIAMYRSALEITAAAGYEHYEISSYARPGFRSRHNTVYWTLGDYRGAGAGAHSFQRRPVAIRWANVKDPRAYVRRRREGKPPWARREVIGREVLLAEALMLGLRMMEGVDRARYRDELGTDPLDCFGDRLAEAFSRGWIEMRDGRLRLTAAGVLFSDEIFARLF